MQPFPLCTLAIVVTISAICTADVMGEKIKFFQGNVLQMINEFNSSQDSPNCSQQVSIYSRKVAKLPRRLGSCNNSKYWAKDTTGSPGVLNNNTKGSFGLKHVVLYCSRINISGYNTLWRTSLEVSAAATTTSHDQPPFRKIIFQLRCMNSNGSIFRKDVVYDVEKVEPNKTVLHVTQKPTTAGTAVTCTDLSLNSTFTTPQSPSIKPAHGNADHKNNLGMTIGFPVSIGVALLGVVFVYQHRKRIIDKYTALFSRKNNNTVETTESFLSI